MPKKWKVLPSSHESIRNLRKRKLPSKDRQKTISRRFFENSTCSSSFFLYHNDIYIVIVIRTLHEFDLFFSLFYMPFSFHRTLSELKEVEEEIVHLVLDMVLLIICSLFLLAIVDLVVGMDGYCLPSRFDLSSLVSCRSQRDLRRQALLRQQQDQELAECTFSPEVHAAPEYISRIAQSFALTKDIRSFQDGMIGAGDDAHTRRPDWR